ncbi:hypothetical protein BJV74DRAFT_978753 [Russula compacta]|nr:hypothetical protein BJV74DRAFT_978753 [Russula compacta]
MPSLFSRSRTTSSPLKSQRQTTEPLDEFGRVSSRASARAGPATIPAKKDKNVEKTRTRTLSAAKGRAPGPILPEEELIIPDGSFFPLNLDPPGGDHLASPSGSEHDYGYLSYHHQVALGPDEVHRLVQTVCEELGTRGLTTPFLFSSLALDVNSSGVRRLVQAFLRTCVSFPAPDAEHTWREEARFAAPAELAMCLRWGLARVMRVYGGNVVRGLISWDMYVEWSEAEVAQDYPATHFETLVTPLQQPLPLIIIDVLSLLARLTAHSSSSGHTPPTLSPLFGPILFGLGPAALPFHHTYLQYLRATNAMEHVLLAFVRWQDAPCNESSGSFGGPGSAASLGVPTRLKDWIRGYPAMLPEPSTRSRKHDRLQPRRGARTVRVVSVRRNVRMYTPDLVKCAASWASRPPSGVTHAPNPFAQSRDWERVAPPTLKLAPRFADSFKKRMDLPPTFHPHTGIASSNASIASSTTISTLGDSPTDYFGLGKPAIAGEERFRSLTDLKWGEFESMGFGGLESGEKKLQFDLTESARTSRASKRTTLTWTDFSTSGFTRTDAPLSATLQFSTPLINSISSWPEQQADITRKLKKTQKSLPPFGWDTEPVMGQEAIIEEAFLDVFCDLLYGGGWMDIEREVMDRECNWALIEFKALPLTRSTVSGGTDPRTSSTVFLFEEFVPLEYRQQLSAGVQNKRTLASFFSPGKTKQWKQAATLNGRPYVVGHVPRSLNSREAEFEGLLRGNNSSTKIISLGRDGPVKRDVKHSQNGTLGSSPDPALNHTRSEDISSPSFVPPREEAPLAPSTPVVGTKRRFRLPTGLPLTPNARTSGLTPSEAQDIDFEIRLASYSDDELNSLNASSRKMTKEERRRSKDDAWVDILVASHSRRAANQDAEIRRPGGPRPRNISRQDPEVASQEVAEVLAAIRGPSPLFDGESVDIEPMNVPHRSMLDNRGSPLEEIYAPTIPGSVDLTLTEPEEVQEVVVQPPPPPPPPPPRSQRRMGYFDLHPDRRPSPIRVGAGEDVDLDHFASAAAGGFEDHAPAPRRSDVTESVYSSDSTPPASPKADRLKFATERPQQQQQQHQQQRQPEPITQPSFPSLLPVLAPAPALSGKPGPKASSLIEMYREKERQATSKSSPSKSSAIPTAAATQPDPEQQPTTPEATKESMPLPPPPPEPPLPELSLPSPDSAPVMGQEVVEDVGELEGEILEYAEPTNFELDPGRESPYRYVHGAPLHNVVEEEEED